MKLTTVIGKRSGLGEAIECDTTDLPQVSIDALLRYGFQRWVNDRVGGSDTDASQKITAAKEIIAKLIAGDMERATRTSVDPITAIMRSMIKARLPKDTRDKLKDEKAADVAKFLDKVIEEKLTEKQQTALRSLATDEYKRREAERAKIAKLDLGPLDFDPDSEDDAE